jgi:glutamyl-tRNA synthetase
LSHEVWEAAVRNLADKLEIKAASAFMTLRIAITGKAATPPLFEVGQVIGLEEVITRLDKAIAAL